MDVLLNGCTRLAPVVGEQTTLGEAQENLKLAQEDVAAYLAAKAAYELAEHNKIVAEKACVDATALYEETLTEADRLTAIYLEAVAYESQMAAAKNAAEADDSTAAKTDSQRVEAKAAADLQAATDAKDRG